LRFRPFRCARLARRDTNVSWRCQPRPAFLLRSGLAVARPTLIVVVHSRQGLPPPTAARARPHSACSPRMVVGAHIAVDMARCPTVPPRRRLPPGATMRAGTPERTRCHSPALRAASSPRHSGPGESTLARRGVAVTIGDQAAPYMRESRMVDLEPGTGG